LLYIRVAAVHLEIINSPIGICLCIILQIVFIPRIATTRVSSKVTINSKFKAFSMNLQYIICAIHTISGIYTVRHSYWTPYL